MRSSLINSQIVRSRLNHLIYYTRPPGMVFKELTFINAVITKVLLFLLCKIHLDTLLAALLGLPGINLKIIKVMIHLPSFFLWTVRKNINVPIKTIAFLVMQIMGLILEVVLIFILQITVNQIRLHIAVFLIRME